MRLEYMFLNSNEEDTELQKDPREEVIVKKKFNANTVKLVALSNNVSVVKEADAKEIDGKTIVIARVFDDPKDGPMHGVVKHHCVYPDSRQSSSLTRHVAIPFIAKYWLCAETYDKDKANAERKLEHMNVKIGRDTHVVQVPSFGARKRSMQERP